MNKDINNYCTKLKFTKIQLDAMHQLYFKYFEPKINKIFDGTPCIAIWDEQTMAWSGLKFDGEGKERLYGFTAYDAKNDPLWDHFANLAPYMSLTCAISRMTPHSKLNIHIDRKKRACAIYFPITGCTDKCISSYYFANDNDIVIDENDITKPKVLMTKNPVPALNYSITDNAVIFDSQEFHGVHNNQDCLRVAFGWNFKQEYKSYVECVEILKTLGYV